MSQLSTFSFKPNDTATNKILLTFRVGDQIYGLPVPDVIRIIEMVTITPLAGLPYSIRGVINVQGKVTSVLDVRRRFGLPEQAYGLHTPIILVDVHQGQQMMGLVVDEVLNVITVGAADMEAPETIVPAEIAPQILHGMTYLASMAKINRQPVPVLHVQALLSATEQGQLTQALATPGLFASQELGYE